MARKALTKPQDRLHIVPLAQPAPAHLLPLPPAEDAGRRELAAPPLRPAAIQDLLDAHRLDDAAKLALDTLDRLDADGKEWAAAVALVLRACQAQMAARPPLDGVPPRLIRPDERAAQAFAQICSLLSLQNAQLDELKATIAELI